MQSSTIKKVFSDLCYLTRPVSITKFILVLSVIALFTQAAKGQADKELSTNQNYKQSLNVISKEIEALSRNLNANRSLLETEQTELLKSERALSDIRKKLSEAKQGISAALIVIDTLEDRNKELTQQQLESRKTLAGLIENHYKNGISSQLKLVLNQENPYAVGRLNNYQSYFSNAINERFRQLEIQVAASRALRAEQRIKVAELQSLEQEQEFLAQTQEQQANKRRQVIARLDTKVAISESKLKKLNSDRKRLNLLINKLEKQKAELARIEQERRKAERIAAEKAAAKAKRKGNAPVIKPKARTPVKGGFLKQKGRLNCPVTQSAVTKFGQRIVASGMRSEGMFYDTKSTVPVKSIFRGQVLFSDFLKGFGLLLIVDHGDDHISLYGHNEVLYKKVGDSVATNEVISKTGTTGGLKSAGLYFEIRNNTTPVNPGNWCN